MNIFDVHRHIFKCRKSFAADVTILVLLAIMNSFDMYFHLANLRKDFFTKVTFMALLTFMNMNGLSVQI